MTDQQTPDLTPEEITVVRQAWAAIKPVLTAAVAALVPNDEDEDEAVAAEIDAAQDEHDADIRVLAKLALNACLDGQDDLAADHLADLDADQLYAIEAAASGLAIHASRLRRPMIDAEHAAAVAQAEAEQPEPARVLNSRTDLAATLRAVEIDRDQWRDRARHWKAATVSADATLDALRARAEQAEAKRDEFRSEMLRLGDLLGDACRRAEDTGRRLAEMRERAERGEANAKDWRTAAQTAEKVLAGARAALDRVRQVATNLRTEQEYGGRYDANQDAADRIDTAITGTDEHS